MTLTRGKLQKAADLSGEARPVAFAPTELGPRGRVVQRSVVDADAHAKDLVRAAEERARLMLEAAARAAGDVRLQAEAEGRADGVADVAARAIALAAREARADEQNLDRIVEIARLLAERVLGEALTLAPERIVALARQAISEARGARRVRVVAHPDDAEILEQKRETLGMAPGAVAVIADPARPRGNLRLETDIGVLDAALAPQLERLARKLRENLAK